MARVVVTGATGFVGREIVPILLSAGHEVHTIGRTVSGVDGTVHHRVDLLDGPPRGLEEIEPDALMHLAWYAEHGKFWGAPENCDWVAASLQLVRSFANAGGRRVVVAGSCAEYAWDRPVLNENDISAGSPATLYGQAKRALFDILVAAAPVLELSLGWGRIFMPYGAHEHPNRLLGTLIAAREAGIVAEFTAGEQVRDFLHGSDVAGALIALLDSGVEGAVNIGSGEGISVREFVARAAGIADYAGRVRLGGCAMRPGEPESIVADISRLTGEVGFRPRYSLAEGLAKALAPR